ncbi:MAG: TetR/AcrR family transcriptional regulator, partial [Candidatus Ornithospirochaeta sp.]
IGQKGGVMNRQEKNQMTRRKIVESALREFSKSGYRGCSVNDICQNGGVSKGIVYHYFDTKEELYLVCVEECFTLLEEFIGKDLIEWNGECEAGLEEYFRRRDNFFIKNPKYQNIFTEAIVYPSTNLKKRISEKISSFEELNKRILRNMIEHVELRDGLSIEDVIEVFLDYQGYINSSPNKNGVENDFHEHERRAKKAISILLYGVVKR